MMRKYRNIKILVDGIKFDSKLEAQRYHILKLMEQAGEISDLELQPKIVIWKSEKKIKGMTNQIVYKPDFRYQEAGKMVIEDVKGMKTKEYLIKRKILLHDCLNSGTVFREYYRGGRVVDFEG